MMKEKANVQSAAPRKVKGTVLFTVVCVMMVLIVFLMGTLALATTANNRAMKNFSTAQTQQTAKAGVEAVMAAMRNDKDVAQAVANITATTPITNIAIDLESTSMGRIQDVKVELAGTKYIVDTHDDSATKNQMVPKKVIRISATAVQGSASSTVTAYVLSDPDSGNSDTVTVSPSANGFVSTGGAGTSNHVSAYGGTAFGFDDIYGYEYEGGVRKLGADGKPIAKTAYERNLAGYYELRNGQIEESDIRINGNLKVVASTPTVVLKGLGSGLTVWGSFNVENDIAVVTENSQFKTGTGYLADGISYKDIPYWYVDNTLYINGTIKDKSAQKPTSATPTVVNLYCGELVWAQGDVNFPTNIYCFNSVDGTMEPDVTGIPQTQKGVSTFTGNNSNLLYNWSKSIMQVDGTSKPGCSGNFYSNGDLVLNSDGGGTFGTSGHGNVVKIQGNLTIKKGNYTVNGDLYVGGSLAVNGGSLKVTGNLYCDAAFTGSVTVDGTINPLRVGVARVETNENLKSGYSVQSGTVTLSGPTTIPNPWNASETLNVRAAIFGYNGAVQWFEKDNDCTLAIDGDHVMANYSWGLQDIGQPSTYTVYVDSANNVVDKGIAVETITKYYDASNNEIPDVEIYPKEYTRGVLTGMEQYNASTPVEKTKVVTFPYEILTDSTKTPYSTYTDVKDSSRTDADNNPISDKKLCEDNVFKIGGGLSTVKGNPDGKIAYNAGTKTYTIGDSCSICGGLDGETLVLSPPKNTAIWVVIVPDGSNNFYIGGGSCSAKIILDDSTADKNGTVNILLKSDITATAKDRFITTAKYDALLSSNQSFQMFTEDKYKMDGVDIAPNIGINIYSDTNGRKISLTQNHQIVANINAPYCDYETANNGITTSNAHIYYNRFDTQSRAEQERKYGVIGQCIVKNFSSSNEWCLLYKPTTGGTVPPPGEDNFEDALMTSWSVLYWENY